MAVPAKRKPGRPSSYDPNELPKITKLCMLGLTNEQLAGHAGVDVTTIDRWIKNDPEFRGAVKAGREDADGNVVHSLYSRALGYSHPEEKIFYDTKVGEEVRVETVKHYPPDPVAAIFWLKNRQREHWRDVRSNELSGPGGRPIALEHLPSKQLEVGERAKLRAFLEGQVTDVEDLNEIEEQGDGDDDGSESRD